MLHLLSNKDFARKFKPVLREIELVELQIHQKRGWFIFETHVCTKQELLESKHFSRINSITEKIGDDVENWSKNGQLSLIEAKLYNDCKDNVDEELHNVRKKIVERQDTFWESFANIFGNFMDHIMDNLPIVNIPLRLFSGVVKALLPGKKDRKRKLSASR